jgi:ubiquinone/menaquinone biosynthesis C-methylase UbiE
LNQDTATHDGTVDRQFGPRAQEYLTSAVHAQGADLDQLAALVAARPGSRVLDLGCGAGHVSFNVAPHAAQVVAYDLSPQMLEVVADAARQKGLSNLECRAGRAEALPFADGEFDIVLCRFSAHHWADVPRALREACRVLKPSGITAFVDIYAHGSPLLDTWLQMLEVLRDTSHVRDYALSEWVQMLGSAGFTLQDITLRRLRMHFDTWVARMRTPPDHVAALRSMLSIASEPVKQHFAIEADGSFWIDSAAMVAVKESYR